MIVHALVEGPSEKALLELWARRLLKDHELRAYPHEGKGRFDPDHANPRKRGLLDQLPSKLRAFGKSLDSHSERVLVLVDADNDSVSEMKLKLDRLIQRMAPAPLVIFRFAIEELEAFYLADQKALRAAFPNYNQKLARQYVPDSICGTWELFGDVIGDNGGNKVQWAQAMANVLTTRPEQSRSPSFRELCTGLRELVASRAKSAPRKKKPRRAKVAVDRDATGRRKW